MSLALSDVAFVAVSALGHVAEAQINGTERERFGNDLYGAYGTTFTTADGVIVYAVGISPKQWSGLLEATNATAAVAAIEAEHGVSFRDEGERFAHREAITAAIAPWVAAHGIDEVAARFDDLGVCWGRYQTFKELVDDDPRVSIESELFRNVDQPNIGTYLTPGSPVAFDGKLPVEPTLPLVWGSTPRPSSPTYSASVLPRSGRCTTTVLSPRERRQARVDLRFERQPAAGRPL